MLLLLFNLLVGCSDHMVAKVIPRVPDILVYPEHVEFGRLISGQEKAEKTFTVINTGDGDLKIFAPVLVSGNDRYTLQDTEDEYTIPGGELLDFTIEYEPKTFEANGAYIDIQSNDEDEPLSRVTIEGYGDAPVMTVSPFDFDYGLISIGCDNEEHITIRNDGNMDLTINEIIQMVTQPVDIIMELGSLPEAPWFLTPGQEIDFLVSYIPTNVGTDESEVVIRGSDPQTPEIITTQVGKGDVEKWFSQQWEQEEIAMLDVLWVVDDSGSMGIFQQNLSSNIGAFLSTFVNSGADYHMGVVTTSWYTFGSFVDSSTSNAEALLSSMIVVGIQGSGHETGLEMAKQALSVGAAKPGGDFFRENAALVVIFVSDEMDHSSPWASYIPFFDSIKPPGSFIPYGVIGDMPSGCSYLSNGNHRSADAGYGYWDLIDHYGGQWFSICASDWGVQLQQLADNVTNRKTFLLDEPDPIEETIEVRVNGQISSNWDYDLAVNGVVFHDGHLPEEGQTISVDYAVWGCGGE